MLYKVITSRNNQEIKRLKMLLQPHKRHKSDTFLIEGPKFIHDAINAGVEIVTLVVSDSFRGEVPVTAHWTEVMYVSEELSKYLSDTKTPQGMIAEAKRNWHTVSEVTTTGIGKQHLLVAWCIQDPGNVGIIVRSSAAFGIGGLIISADSADPFSPKAVRASAGAVLRFPLARAEKLGELVESLRKKGFSTYWTGAQAQIELQHLVRHKTAKLPVAVFIGSEGMGFSEEEKNIIGQGIRIPISTDIESLNAGVVASITAYELTR
ncbi:MAG: RNA methyltransferase [Planctomycetota bacterium]